MSRVCERNLRVRNPRGLEATTTAPAATILHNKQVQLEQQEQEQQQIRQSLPPGMVSVQTKRVRTFSSGKSEKRNERISKNNFLNSEKFDFEKTLFSPFSPSSSSPSPPPSSSFSHSSSSNSPPKTQPSATFSSPYACTSPPERRRSPVSSSALASEFLSPPLDGTEFQDLPSSTQSSQTGNAVGFLNFLDQVPPAEEPRQHQNAMGFLDFVGTGSSNKSMVKVGADIQYSQLPDPQQQQQLQQLQQQQRKKGPIVKGVDPSSLAGLRSHLNEDEESLRSQKIPEIKAASLSCLLDVLLHPSQGNPKFRRVFFLTLRTFSTPKELVQTLCSRYRDETNPQISTLIVELFSDWWMSHYDRDWGESKEEAVKEFQPFLVYLESSPSAQHRTHFRQLSDEVNSARIWFSQLGLENVTNHWKGGEGIEGGGCLDFADLSASEISDTLTCYAFSIFKKLREHEHFAWLKGKQALEEFENISELVDLFNRLSSWASREIVTKARLKDRVEIIEKMVEIAQLLYNQQNFQCVKAILSGVTASFIARMTKTLKEVSPEVMAILKDLEMKLTFERNFKNLREIMDGVIPPCIPYLGMYQKDLLFLNDGNPDKIGHLVNFSKRIRLADIIFDISFCQKGSFSNLQPNPAIIALIYSCPVFSEKELSLWSRRVDSKDPEMVIAELIQEEKRFLLREKDHEEREKILLAQVDELEAKLAEAKKRISEFEKRSAAIGTSESFSCDDIFLCTSHSPESSALSLSNSFSSSCSSLPSASSIPSSSLSLSPTTSSTVKSRPSASSASSLSPSPLTLTPPLSSSSPPSSSSSSSISSSFSLSSSTPTSSSTPAPSLSPPFPSPSPSSSPFSSPSHSQSAPVAASISPRRSTIHSRPAPRSPSRQVVGTKGPRSPNPNVSNVWEATESVSVGLKQLRERSRIRRLSQVAQEDPSTWSVGEVCNWVGQVAGTKWVEPFAENHILGADLVDMVVDELMLFVDDEEVCLKIHREMRILKGEEAPQMDEEEKKRKTKPTGKRPNLADFRLDNLTSFYLRNQHQEQSTEEVERNRTSPKWKTHSPSFSTTIPTATQTSTQTPTPPTKSTTPPLTIITPSTPTTPSPPNQRQPNSTTTTISTEPIYGQSKSLLSKGTRTNPKSRRSKSQKKERVKEKEKEKENPLWLSGEGEVQTNDSLLQATPLSPKTKPKFTKRNDGFI